MDYSFDTDGKLPRGLEVRDSGNSIAIQSDGKIVEAGIRFYSNDDDITVIRYNSKVNTGIVYIANQNIEIDICPNPFSTSTTLKINQILNAATIAVFNSFGEQVKQINNISGNKLTIDGNDLQSGIYFLQLTENHIFLSNGIIEIK